MTQRSVASMMEEARKHGMLHLVQYELTRVPPALFFDASFGSSSRGDFAASLVRLDLSFNQLQGPHAIPDAIGTLIALRELYLNNNPKLTQLPSALALCTKLQAVDVSSSLLKSFPSELGRLQHLRMINIDNTPLQRRWEIKGHLLRQEEEKDPFILSFNSCVNSIKATSTGSPTKTAATVCQQILCKLRRKDEREQLKRDLFHTLHDKTYRLERCPDKVAASEALQSGLGRVLKLFPRANDIHTLICNAERIFPPEFSIQSFENLDANRVRRVFDALQAATERKKRAADLELKLRKFYFDRIDPTKVENIVHQIYEHLPDLRDIKFLIKHASKLLPIEASQLNGEQIQRDIVTLKEQLKQERMLLSTNL